ncbi:putative Reverse transcriptase (RNA dependent DNA polymerase) [Trypanosoma vivax]|nr:putative Reverse transcriptase (RNA dependent DNA polymerase) [Trypanosoma vivax]
MAAVFVDYARPFDSVDHGCIVKELLSFGVGKHPVAWIAGFLKGRTAKVRVNKVLSEDVGLTCGVPQGSDLGPLLFIVTVDSLSKRLNCVPELQHGFSCGRSHRSAHERCPERNPQNHPEGSDCITNCSGECYMEVSAEKPEYTLFDARETKPTESESRRECAEGGARAEAAWSHHAAAQGAEQACAEHEGTGQHAALATQGSGITGMGSR